MAKRTPIDAKQAFVAALLEDPNVGILNAYVAAGFKRDTGNAARFHRDPEVQAMLAEARAERAKRTEITADMVLERWWQIATADPNELVRHEQRACRYCYGDGHFYQWRDHVEFFEACEKARNAKKPEPDDVGGYGYDQTAEPNHDCPRCNGEGFGATIITDTRRLKGPARLLYAGMKEGRDGIEIKMQDQAKALENVARHLGMFVDRKEISGPDGGPMQVEQVQADAESFTSAILGLAARAAEDCGTGETDTTGEGAA